MPFRWDEAVGRFRDAETGRLVAEAKVRLAVDRVADAASDRLADLTERLIRGDLLLADWQRQSMAVIKTSHVASGVVAQGGTAQMTPAAYGYLGSEIKTQYAYLRRFANEIGAGTVPLDGRLVSRAGMYGQHARVTYEEIRTRGAAGRGYDEEKSILHPAEHCASCVAEAGRGWVPLGSLIPIGQRTCLTRCRCTISRRRSAETVVPLRAAS